MGFDGWGQKKGPRKLITDGPSVNFGDADTVYTIDQFNALKIWKAQGVTAGDGVEAGFCFGLSAVWSYLQLKGQDLPYWEKVCHLPPTAATEVQKTYEQFGGADAGRIKGGAECAGLQIQKDMVMEAFHGEQGVGQLVDFIARNPGVFILALNTQFDKGVHAVALSSLKGYHYFDPNRGHYAVADVRRFKEALVPCIELYFQSKAAAKLVLHGVKKIKGGLVSRIKTWAE
jgi:hypothetical protein